MLPVTAAAYYKAPQTLDAATQAQYQLLYQTFLNPPSDVLSFYQPVALDPPATGKPDPVVDLGDAVNGTIDRSLWLAILAPTPTSTDAVRAAIARADPLDRRLPGDADARPGAAADDDGRRRASTRGWSSRSPRPSPTPPGSRRSGFGVGPPNYARLPISYADPVLQAPGVVQVTLPPYERLLLWNFDPEEEGTRRLPAPAGRRHRDRRLVTWIRLRYPPVPGSATTSAHGLSPRPGTAGARARATAPAAAAASAGSSPRRPGRCWPPTPPATSRRAA